MFWSKPASLVPVVMKWAALFAVVFAAFGIIFHYAPLTDDNASPWWIVLACIAIFGPLIINVVFSLLEETRCFVGLTTFLVMVFGLMPFFNDLYYGIIHKAFYIYLAISYIGFIVMFLAGTYYNAVTIKARGIYQILLLDLIAFLYYTDTCPAFNPEGTAEHVLVFIFPLAFAVVLALKNRKWWGCLGFLGLIAFGACYFAPDLYTSVFSMEMPKIKFIMTIVYFALAFVGGAMTVLFDGITSYRRYHKPIKTHTGTYGTPRGSSGGGHSSGGYSGGIGSSLGGTYTTGSTPRTGHTAPGRAGSFCGMRRD
jgi:uncharacterized membrane protein YgcG